MAYQTIRVEDREGVALLTLSRPEVMNALSSRMRAELLEALTAAATSARVIVLTGEGRGFCSGQDLADGGNAATLDLEGTLNDEYVPMLRAIYDCPVPTIAAARCGSRSDAAPT